LFKDPNFYTAFKKRADSALTRDQKKFNNNLYDLRARMERPFAWIDRTIESLSKPWREDVGQMNLTVQFAAGLFNAVHE